MSCVETTAYTLVTGVCKGCSKGTPRKEVQTSAKPFGNIREKNKGRQNPSEKRKHTDRQGPPDKLRK